MTSSLATMLLSLCVGGQVEAQYVIRGATVFDGTGSPGQSADVAIRGDRIVAVGSFDVTGSPKVIEAQGLVLAPGFIDLHTHSDRSIVADGTRKNLNYVMQGVTSIVTGNCGSGPVDVGAYLKAVDEKGAGTNVLHLIPHGSLRGRLLPDANRPASAEEIARLREAVDEGMRAGAWGMSTGLIYLPGSFAATDELIALSQIVSQHGGVYVSHMRNEGTRLLESIEEILEIGQRAELPVHISHFKASGQPAWGLAADAVRRVKEARAAGQTVTADQYPYTASSTSLGAMVVPRKYRSKNQLAEALADEAERKKLIAGIQQGLDARGAGKNLVIASYKTNPKWQGRDLKSLAAEQEMPVVDLVLQIQQSGGASMIHFGMTEEEVRLIMQQDFVATASDGSARLPDETKPHPRSYGCFPRKVGRYALEGNVVSLAHAIRSSSGLPATIMGLPKRGFIKEGFFADIVVFDRKEFRDQATFDQPHQYSTGVRYLFVNGRLAVGEGKATDVLAGRALRHASRLESQ